MNITTKLLLAATILSHFSSSAFTPLPTFQTKVTLPTVSKTRLHSTTSSTDISAVREALSDLIKSKNCGPILIRLGWHDAGTYTAADKSGGPRGCMRFAGDGSEANFIANGGLDIARDLVQPIKDSVAADMSYADFWALAAIESVKAMGGPEVTFRVGRKDASSVEESVEEGRHPHPAKGADHLRCVFGRMGLNDQDIVVLSGAHTTGSCHLDRSGFEGPWTEEPLKFDNSYFKDMLEKKWEPRTTSAGCPQFNAGEQMMLISDLVLIEDEKFRPIAEKYATDEKAFFDDFAVSFQKLLELGCEDLQDV